MDKIFDWAEATFTWWRFEQESGNLYRFIGVVVGSPTDAAVDHDFAPVGRTEVLECEDRAQLVRLLEEMATVETAEDEAGASQ